MTYGGLAVAFLAAAGGLLATTWWVVRPVHRWWAALAVAAGVQLGLTVLFDNVMIAAGLFRYSAEASAGLHLALAPIEDLAWPLVAVLMVPSLWALLEHAAASRSTRSRP